MSFKGTLESFVNTLSGASRLTLLDLAALVFLAFRLLFEAGDEVAWREAGDPLLRAALRFRVVGPSALLISVITQRTFLDGLTFAPDTAVVVSVFQFVARRIELTGLG